MNNNAYVREPPIARLGQRVSLLLRYISIFVLGIVCIVHPTIPLIFVGTVLVLSGASCVIGVITGHYRFEWVPLLPMISALLISAVVFAPISSGVTIALIFALSFSLIDRFIHLSIVANILRKLPVKDDEAGR